MKRLFICVLAVAGMAMTAMAGEWKGAISEMGCGAKHKAGSAADAKCVQACVKAKGAKPVLVTEDGKVYAITNADKVMEHLGHIVTVVGIIEGDTLTIETVRM